jgi:hypothetical protein
VWCVFVGRWWAVPCFGGPDAFNRHFHGQCGRGFDASVPARFLVPPLLFMAETASGTRNTRIVRWPACPFQNCRTGAEGVVITGGDRTYLGGSTEVATSCSQGLDLKNFTGWNDRKRQRGGWRAHRPRSRPGGTIDFFGGEPGSTDRVFQ